MTKQELETRIKQALAELQTAIEDAKAAAIKYGDGEENYPFEVGFLSSRIKGALGCLEDAVAQPADLEQSKVVMLDMFRQKF